MALINEYLDGGVVTAREGTLLQPGELQAADECVYRLHDSAIYSAPGRIAYNSDTIVDGAGSTCSIKGLAHLAFQGNQTDRILLLAGSDNENDDPAHLARNGLLYSSVFTSVAGSATFSVVTGYGQVLGVNVHNGNTIIDSANNVFTSAMIGARIIGGGIKANTYIFAIPDPKHATLNQPPASDGTNPETVFLDYGIPVVPNDFGSESLDIVQWNNYYYGIGFGTIQRFYYRDIVITNWSSTYTQTDSLFTCRPSGLLPVAVQPIAKVVATTGPPLPGWSELLGNGYYWFLTTEVFNPGQDDEVEGTYAPIDANKNSLDPIVVSITDYAKSQLTIYRRIPDGTSTGTTPYQANDGSPDSAHYRFSTHWRIYMAKGTDAITRPSLAAFRLIGTYAMLNGDGTPNDAALLVDSNVQVSGYASAVGTITGGTAWQNSSRLTGPPDNSFAYGKSNSSVNTAGSISAVNNLTTFLFTNSTGGSYAGLTVVGIQITVHGCVLDGSNGDATLIVVPQTTGGKNAGPQTIKFHAGTRLGANGQVISWQSAYQNISVGGPLDTLGVTWVDTDFKADGSGPFQLGLWKPYATGENSGVGVDSALVTVFFTGTTINLNGKPFRVITYQDALGVPTDFPAAFPPPQASTGDVFHGSIVVNDVGVNNTLRYSLPGEAESFPAPYILSFNNRRKDKVTLIRRLGQILIVGMTETIERVNYLPSEVDIDFREGIAHETIASDHGIVGPMAASVFTMPGGGPMLAYVAYNGLHVTDGVTTRFLNMDVNFTGLVDPAYVSKTVLRVYPKENWIIVYYTPLGGSKNTRALVFSYDQPKANGMLRVTGPISVGARSAVDAALNGLPILLTGHPTAGKVYVEDQGTTLPTSYSDGVATVVGAPNVITRHIYPSGLDRTARVERVYLQHSAYGTLTSNISVTMTQGSPTLTTSGGAFSVVAVGMLAVHANIPPDAVVTAIAGGNNSLTLSQNADVTQTVNVKFDNGTLAITPRGQNIGEAVQEADSHYVSTINGGLVVAEADNSRESVAFRFQRIRMPDNSIVNLQTPLRLHYFGLDTKDAGKEQNRAGS